jgi:uncharacterized protein YoxC
MPQSNDLNKEYVKELELELRSFEKKAEGSDKNMRLIVYPATFAFIILAAYGFYLIQSLASDVSKMAITMDRMANSVETNMSSMSSTMSNMKGDIGLLSSTIQGMSSDIGDMSSNTKTMVENIGGMKSATYDMAASTNNMQRDLWSLNQNVSTPLSFMNNFLPWQNNTNGRFPGSKAPLPPSYYSYPAQQQIPQLNLPVLPTLPQIPSTPTIGGGNGQSSLGTLPTTDGKKVNYNQTLSPNMLSAPAKNI